MEWKPNGTMRLHPFELIQQEPGIHVRYRNDWHIGAFEIVGTGIRENRVRIEEIEL